MIAKALFERTPDLLPVVSIKLYKDQEQSSQKKPHAEQVRKRGMIMKRGYVFVHLCACVCMCLLAHVRVCVCVCVCVHVYGLARVRIGCSADCLTFDRRRHFNTNFQERFFVLGGGFLKYYKIPPVALNHGSPEEYVENPKHRPQGVLNCRGMVVVEKNQPVSLLRTSQDGSPASPGVSHEFVVTDNSQRSITCRCQSEIDKLSWIDALNRSATEHHGNHVVAVSVSLGGDTINMKDFRLPVLKDGKPRDYLAWILEAELAALSPKEKVVRYFLRCIDLYSQAVIGRNQDALRSLIGTPALALSYDEIMHVLLGSTLPYLLRARYFTLMARLYVDRDPQTPSPVVSCTRLWSKVVPEESDLDMSTCATTSSYSVPVCTNGFVDLQLVLLQTIPLLAGCKDEEGKPSLNAGNGEPSRGQLEMVQAQLQLTSSLFEFGYFRDDVGTQSLLFESTFQMLDSRRKNDTSLRRGGHQNEHPHSSSHRLQRQACQHEILSQDELKLHEVREDAIRFMLKLVELRLDYRITHCISAWESVFESLRSRPDGLKCLVRGSPGHDMTSNVSIDFLSHRSDVSLGEQDDEMREVLHNIFMEFDTLLVRLKEQSFGHNLVSPPEIGSDVYQPGDLNDETQQMLLSLCSFRHQPLTMSAMALLVRNMTQRHALVSRLKEVQILVYPQAARVHKETLFIIERLSHLQKFCAADEPSAYEEASKLLRRMTKEVTVSLHNRPELAKQNQTILLNLEINKPIRRILNLHLARDSSRHDAGELEADLALNLPRRDLFQLCYSFVKELVHQNPKGQMVFFPHIEVFREHMGIEGLNVSDTITAIVRDNVRLCRRVADNWLRTYVQAIKAWGRRARWLSFFQAFMVVRGKNPVKRMQDLILRLLLEEKEAVLDLTCDYTRSKFLSIRDARYGMTRLDLLRADDHKRPVFSLLKYHSATLKTLAMCAFGRNAENQMKIAMEVGINTIIENILDVDLKQDGTRDSAINPDAVRYVQVGWVALFTDVYVSCHDTVITKEVAQAPRVWGSTIARGGSSLMAFFASTLASFEARARVFRVEDFAGNREIFRGFEDGFGHDAESHLELVEQCVRASLVYCNRWSFLVKSDKLHLPEAQALRDSALRVYYIAFKLQLNDLCKWCAELITSLSILGIDGARLEVQVDDKVSASSKIEPEQAMLEGWPQFREYLSLVVSVDVAPSQLPYSSDMSDVVLNKSIQDIALTLGSTNAYMNDHLQSLREFCRVIARPESDEFLRLLGLKVLRAILYMRPDQEGISRAKLENEFQLLLDNQPCSALGSYEHEHWQTRIAHLGAVQVVCSSFLSDDRDVCTAALQLAVALLDGGNPEAQKLFTARMLPASSATFFTKLHQLFRDSREEIRLAKRRRKQAAAENLALMKAGVRARPDTEAQQGYAQGQGHMKEAMLMMQRMCNGDSVLDDVLRRQRLNHNSYDFFVETELYLEAIEHELRDACFRGQYDLVEIAISGFEFLSAGEQLETQARNHNYVPYLPFLPAPAFQRC